MKQYVVDELRLEDYEKVKKWLDKNCETSGLGGLYWIPLEEGLLSELQASHDECRPHCFSLELEEGRLSCELLIRTRASLRCNCTGYATTEQRIWLMDYIDAMLNEVGVSA